MECMKNKILNLIKSAVWFVLCLLVGALIFEGFRSLANSNEPAKKIYLNICSNEDEVDYNELDGVTFSTEKVGVTDCGTENVPYVNAASLWHDLKEDKPPLRKWVMFRYSGGGVNPTALHYGAMSDDVWIVTRGDGTQRIEVLYECYDKIEWLDFDELK